MKPEVNFIKALNESVKRHPTRASLAAQKLLESKGEVDPSLIPYRPKLRLESKPSKRLVNGLEYVEWGSSVLVSPTKTYEQFEKDIEDLESTKDIQDYMDDNFILVKEESEEESEFSPGVDYKTIIGTLTFISQEGDQVFLSDQNNENIVMDLEDFKEIEPVAVNSSLETTQVDDIATPLGTLENNYKARYKRIQDGTIYEEMFTASTAEEFDEKCSEVESRDDFVEWVTFDVPTEEISEDSDLLFDEEEDLAYKIGEDYDSDLGHFVVLGYKEGLYEIEMDGETFTLTEEEIDSLSPIRG